jgi:hypothetical protein
MDEERKFEDQLTKFPIDEVPQFIDEPPISVDERPRYTEEEELELRTLWDEVSKTVDDEDLVPFTKDRSTENLEASFSETPKLMEHSPPACTTKEFAEIFVKARWFTRGWTLQELIAPHNLIFFSHDWVKIGTKSMARLAMLIAECTGVPERVLESGDFSDNSLAQRMSWAAFRSTTRIEDMAYCLMGLFEIHMPMLYGEGELAFIRLQEEIIKRSDDMSIFG